MKCMSCGAIIPPEFKAAIASNICAGCGGEIMNEATLELLDELKEALQEMPNDPEGIAGWLLSHYEMRKFGSAQPVGQFYGNVPQQHQPQMSPQQQQFYGGENQLPTNPHYQQFMNNGQRPNMLMDKEAQLRANPKVAQNKLQQFYANAGIKQNNQNKYAVLAQQIQSDGMNGPDYGDPSFDQGYDPYDQNGIPEESNDPEFTQAVLNASSEKPMTHNDIAALQGLMSGAGTNEEGYDPSLPPALNNDRMDRLRKQQELSMGGKVGKISRSS